MIEVKWGKINILLHDTKAKIIIYVQQLIFISIKNKDTNYRLLLIVDQILKLIWYQIKRLLLRFNFSQMDKSATIFFLSFL